MRIGTTEPKPVTEKILWTGSHYVSWALPDDDPHKTFNLISADEVAKWKAGQVLRVYVTPKAYDGFLVTGHGFYVTKVTIE